jgi:2-keto-4-pentenoate hydratase/2-oxohepta-3-ene-1,7-dioic acid hydratase in catechol pathway
VSKPEKIVCVGQNYRDHRSEMGGVEVTEPTLFGKFAATVIGQGPRGLRVTQRLNGKLMQDGNTDDLIFDVPYLVAFVSTLFTLEPGDLILTGTPSGVGWARDPKISLQDGDVVEIAVEGISLLSNPAVAEAT